jgi:hypothetical protein
MVKIKGMNQKAAAAGEKQAANKKVKDAQAAAAGEKETQKDWSQGANLRGQQKSDESAAKADEAARKRKEKEALLAEEEANLGPGGKVKKTQPLTKKNVKGKKKNDLSLLEDALVGAADKKVKAKRQAEKLKEEKLKQEQAKKKEKEEKPIDPLLANTNAMIAGTEDDLIGRAANKARDEDGNATGIDGALSTLNISSGVAAPVTSAKALFKAFEERNMPLVKEDYPHLKMSQYKEKIFQMWKKSPENPANQIV